MLFFSSMDRVQKQALALIIFSCLLRLFSLSYYQLIPEEAYYWNYAQHLDFGYLDHPPMVGLLIYLSTRLLGNTEWALRFPAFLCWLGTAYFSYQLSERLRPKSGAWAVLLLACLPFFFIHSLFMTPDSPLALAWSASLFYLYRALVEEETTSWYWAGLCLGLGLLSKYSIVLLAPACLLYLLFQARLWFWRKQPYLSLLLALMVFSPVIYWNAVHDWASFLFQGPQRFQTAKTFSLHEYAVLLLFFLSPLGILALPALLRKLLLRNRADFFLLCFSLFPLGFFAVYSLSHPVKFNWIGPSLLALIPLLAAGISQASAARFLQNRIWLANALVLLLIFTGMLACLITGRPAAFNQLVFKKMIDWRSLTMDCIQLATKLEQQGFAKPVLVPLDLYNIKSELEFYQQQLGTSIVVEARQIFGARSLMYQFWGSRADSAKQPLLLISPDRSDFEKAWLREQIAPLSGLQHFWSYSQGSGLAITEYYYQLVKKKV